jgi:hypothetical protein
VILSNNHNNDHGPNNKTAKLSWWLEIGTTNPLCIYFFGPFVDRVEAESSQEGFSQDLKDENAQVLYCNIKFCQPHQLTIEEDELSIIAFPE